MRHAPCQSSGRRSRCDLRSASRSRPCSPCRLRRARFPSAPGNLRESIPSSTRRECRVCFFFADRESFEVLFDDKSGDAAIAGFGICIREQHENFGFLAVGDPEFAAVHQEVIAVIDGARVAWQKRRSRSRLRSARKRRPCQLASCGQVFLLLIVSSPANDGVIDQGVLYVH